jgi:hypothetical protein
MVPNHCARRRADARGRADFRPRAEPVPAAQVIDRFHATLLDVMKNAQALGVEADWRGSSR